MPGLRCCAKAFSSSGAGASPCGGFSCCRAQALEHVGSSSCGQWARLLRGTWDLLLTGIEPCSLHWQADFNQWTTREVPNTFKRGEMGGTKSHWSIAMFEYSKNQNEVCHSFSISHSQPPPLLTVPSFHVRGIPDFKCPGRRQRPPRSI